MRQIRIHAGLSAAAIFISTAVGLAGAPAARAQTVTYTFAAVTGPAGGSSPTIGGINDSGVVAGSYYDASYVYHGFTYDGTSNTPLSGPEGNTYAYGISNSGAVVGDYTTGRFTDSSFIYSGGANGTYTSLTGPADSPYANSVASGVNDSGVVAGYYSNGQDFDYAGYIYAGGNYTTLTGPAGNTGTVINGINDGGAVVGYYTSSGRTKTGFVYSGGPDGTYLPLLGPAGSAFSVATGINNKGVAVGFYDVPGSQYQGFLFDGGSDSYTAFADPLAVNGTYLQGINDSGQITGYYDDADHVQHNFIATPNADASAAPEPSEWAALGFTGLCIGGLLLKSRKRV